MIRLVDWQKQPYDGLKLEEAQLKSLKDRTSTQRERSRIGKWLLRPIFQKVWVWIFSLGNFVFV